MGIYFNVKDISPETSVNEVYYGKNKKLLAIEKQIGVARKPYLGRRTTIGDNFYADKEIDKVGKMLAEYFGFQYVDFNLMNDVHPNALTMVLGRGIFTGMVTYTDRVKQTKEGMKAGNAMKGFSIYTRITTGMWGNMNFSDAEVLAIILHEIGHNFQHVRNTPLGMYDFIMCCAMWAQLLYLNPIGIIYDTDQRAKLGKQIKNSPFMSSVVSAFSGLKGFISAFSASIDAIYTIFAPFAKIVKATVNTAITVTQDPLSLLSMSKSAEYISDDFANKLGYGAELGTALTKITADKSATGVTKAVYNIPIFKELNDIVTVVASTILSPISSHPPVGKRIKNMITELEKDLKSSDLSPALKKEVRLQIDQLSKCADDMINIPDSSEILQRNIQSQMNRNIDPLSKLILNYTTESVDENEDFDFVEEFFEY